MGTVTLTQAQRKKALYRIALIGTKGARRRYLSTDESGEQVNLVPKREALHFTKAIALAAVKELNRGLESEGRSERFQIEKS